MKKIDLFLVYLGKCSPVSICSQQGFRSLAEIVLLLKRCGCYILIYTLITYSLGVLCILYTAVSVGD